VIFHLQGSPDVLAWRLARILAGTRLKGGVLGRTSSRRLGRTFSRIMGWATSRFASGTDSWRVEVTAPLASSWADYSLSKRLRLAEKSKQYEFIRYK